MMSTDPLAQQIARLAEQQLQHGEDLARIKEQLDNLTAVVVNVSERLDQGGGSADDLDIDLDEGVIKALVQGVVEALSGNIDQVAANVDQLANQMIRLANAGKQQAEEIKELYEHNAENAERFTRTYDQLIALVQSLMKSFKAQAHVNQAQQSGNQL
jgi:ABC-type transporter Mla subunit MlaD